MECENIIFPQNNNECITGLAASILKRFGLNTSHTTISSVNQVFSQYWKHIIILNIKGLNISSFQNKLDHFCFLNKRILTEFTNSNLQNSISIDNFFIQVTEFIQKQNKAWGNAIISTKESHSDFYEWLSQIKKSTKSNEQTVTYASWNGFFEQLQNNTFSNEDINFLNSSLESFCNSLSDTIVFITSEDFEFSSKDVQIPLLWAETKRLQDLRKSEKIYTHMFQNMRVNTGIIGTIATIVIIVLILIFIPLSFK